MDELLMQCLSSFIPLETRELVLDMSGNKDDSFFLSDLVVLVEDLGCLDLVRLQDFPLRVIWVHHITLQVIEHSGKLNCKSRWVET